MIYTQLYGIKYSYLIQIIYPQLYGIKYSHLTQIIYTQLYGIKCPLSNRNNLQTFIWYQVFSSNTNILHTVI